MRQPDVAAATAALLAPMRWPPRRLRTETVARLTHIDAEGKARMVDVTEKEVTERRATARARVAMRPETARLIQEGGVAKGDVLGVARLAGIMAAKRTADLIPLCHPLSLSAVDVTLTCDETEGAVDIEASCRITGRTGVEMGGAHRGERGRAHRLRHVQGRRSRHAHHRRAGSPTRRAASRASSGRPER